MVAATAGCDDYVPKPHSPRQLREKIRQHLSEISDQLLHCHSSVPGTSRHFTAAQQFGGFRSEGVAAVTSNAAPRLAGSFRKKDAKIETERSGFRCIVRRGAILQGSAHAGVDVRISAGGACDLFSDLPGSVQSINGFADSAGSRMKRLSMTDLHETEPKAQIDTVGWLFVAAVAVIAVIAAMALYHGNDTLVANVPRSQS